jgi:hypothetical protein
MQSGYKEEELELSRVRDASLPGYELGREELELSRVRDASLPGYELGREEL